MRRARATALTRIARIIVGLFFFYALLFLRPCIAQETATTFRAASATSRVGDAVGGLALSLTTQEGSVRAGEPVWVTVELRNTSPHPEGIFLYSVSSKVESWPASYQFTIVDAVTARVVQLKKPPMNEFRPIIVPAASHQLDPNSSLFARVRLDEFYDLKAPGRYAVIVNSFVRYVAPTDQTSILLQSNPVKITVLPSSESPSPEGDSKFSIALQTDRPVYAEGQPIFIQLSVTNVTREAVPLGYPEAGELCRLVVLDGLGNPWSPPLNGAWSFMARPSPQTPLQPGETRVLGSFLGDWVSLERWSLSYYREPKPDNYTLSAFTAYGGRSTAKLLHFKVVSRAVAESSPKSELENRVLDHKIEVLLSEYYGALEKTAALIARVHTASDARDLFWRLGSAWGADDEQEFKVALYGLPEVGNPASPYVNVVANFIESYRHLSKVVDAARDMLPPNGPGRQNYMPLPLAHTATPAPEGPPLPEVITCKLDNVIHEFTLSKYYYNAVTSEIQRGYAGLGDAVTPPATPSASSTCH